VNLPAVPAIWRPSPLRPQSSSPADLAGWSFDRYGWHPPKPPRPAWETLLEQCLEYVPCIVLSTILATILAAIGMLVAALWATQILGLIALAILAGFLGGRRR
jgi:hypothetical protein